MTITTVSIIPIIIFGYLLYNYVEVIIEEKYQDYTDRLVEQIASNLDANMQELEKIITPVYYSEELADLLLETNRFDTYSNYRLLTGVFYNSIYSREYIYELELFNLNGKRVISVNGNLTTSPVLEQDWFKDTLKKQGGKHIFIERYQKAEGKEYFVVSMSRAIYDVNTFEKIGVIRVNENQREIRQNLLKINMNYKSEIVILTQAGELVYSSNPELIDSKSAIGLSGLGRSSAIVGSDRQVIGTIPYLMSSQQSESDFQVILLTPEREVLKESQRMQWMFSSFLISFVLVMLCLAIILAYYISNPILQIRNKMKIVEMENFNVRVEVRGHDEIAHLSRGFNEMVNKIDALIHEKYTMQLLKTEAELKALQNQINPHFLNNSLSTIIGLLSSDDQSRASLNLIAIQMIGSLSHLFQYNLDTSQQAVTLATEIDTVKHYLALQKMRFDEKLEYHFELEERVMQAEVAKMFLQPLIENAILHGIELKRGSGEVVVKAEMSDGCLLVTIADNGLGMSDEQIKTLNTLLTSGVEEQQAFADREVGICNVNARIQLMYGTDYGLSYQVNQTEGNGVVATVKFPWKLDGDTA